ncbi:putative pectinesterase/pectinesterase inhibitor 12 [Tasmannia lanceolata]|uniref:putative pectinesterase/pectinesterase inhibitor 12 n=1 Tax=Tasmannia lanceolata TaxID=3420 RepID=UPI0040636856
MASKSLLNSSLLLSAIYFTTTLALNSSTTTTTTTSLNTHLSHVKSVCKSTPYPDVCFASLKLSISIGINPNIVTYVLQSLQNALSETGKLSDLFQNAAAGIVEKQKGSIQDCKELHQSTLSSLKKSISQIHNKQSDVKSYLSAALTNKNTCLEGLESASGPLKSTLVTSTIDAYKQVSNSLAMIPSSTSTPSGGPAHRRRLLGFPKWLSRKDRRILQSSGDEYDPGSILTVASDGSGNFTTINEAISFAPNNSLDRIIIFVRAGVYEENVEIPPYKTNIVLLGDGRDVTTITGSRSVGDGWTTFRSATVAVSGDGFLARDIEFENSAGPEKGQAVALRVNADLVAIYQCSFIGFQDTLYVHSFRQFYRECDIFGTVDFIFGNAAVVFQGCDIVSRKPIPGQSTVITAQSRDDENENTGISIQNCSILPSNDLSSSSGTKSYLGRPLRIYSRTVYIESYIDGFINPAGWSAFSGDLGLDTLYYGEYSNSGPGSGTENRVTWPGYHIMSYDDASNFMVSEFISGDEWLESTSFPYDDGV